MGIKRPSSRLVLLPDYPASASQLGLASAVSEKQIFSLVGPLAWLPEISGRDCNKDEPLAGCSFLFLQSSCNAQPLAFLFLVACFASRLVAISLWHPSRSTSYLIASSIAGMSTGDLFNLDADVGSDDDESFDEETGEVRTKRNGEAGSHIDDSSEEDDDEDDEAAAQAVRDGFIVDEDDDEEESRRKKREKRKRRREEREEEALDAEDLDLIGVPTAPEQSKFKRLKRGHRDDGASKKARGVTDIFADEAEDEDEAAVGEGEFDDFIEQDEFPEDQEDQDDQEVSRDTRKVLAGIQGLNTAGLDEAALEDLRAAFGDGTEYDWALEEQDKMDATEIDPENPLELKDVFEPSQLADKLLTDEDNQIRDTDVPERFQLARRQFSSDTLSLEEQIACRAEEAKFISNAMFGSRCCEPEKKERLNPSQEDAFTKAVAHVLKFFNEDNCDIPFIYNHRRDYLIEAENRYELIDNQGNKIQNGKLLEQRHLFDVFENDLKFKALWQKRRGLRNVYDSVRRASSVQDEIVEELLPMTESMEEIQDLQDYLHFEYSAQIRDAQLQSDEAPDAPKRARGSAGLFERLRASPAYAVVRGFGVTADKFAQNVVEKVGPGFLEDPPEWPEDLADKYIDPNAFTTGQSVLRAAKAMFAEELATSPRLRKHVRQAYFFTGRFDCVRTETGAKKIDEEHPYWEFKYLRDIRLNVAVSPPQRFLRMLKAEEEGLIDLKLRLDDKEDFRRDLTECLMSDYDSEIAQAWNRLRNECLDLALRKLEPLMVKAVKENLRTQSEAVLAQTCRREYYSRLDQAPYKPKGMNFGTTPRVLALAEKRASENFVYYSYVDEDGRSLEQGTLPGLYLADPENKVEEDGGSCLAFVNVVERRRPDVIAISGFRAHTHTLQEDVKKLIERHDLRTAEYDIDDDDSGATARDLLDVVMVNDEVARLYHQSSRARVDYPVLDVHIRFAIALAKYIQSPVKEYAALGNDVRNIRFHPDQGLVPDDKLMKHLETAMVEAVNTVGVEINDAVTEPYIANLLPYISGLGPRKAQTMLQTINRNGGQVFTRADLVGDPESGKLQAVGANVFTNCAGFLSIDFDPAEPLSNYLDSTRIHPEDYEIAKKMAQDALELDEEDLQAEVQEGGDAAIVRRLIREDAQDRVHDLQLEQYAVQLETLFNQQKRSTLENIRAELNSPFEELRRSFHGLTVNQIFTQLTGETVKTLHKGMLISSKVLHPFLGGLKVLLDCGVEGTVSVEDMPTSTPRDRDAFRGLYHRANIVHGRVIKVDRKKFEVKITMDENEVKNGLRKDRIHEEDEDEDQEQEQEQQVDPAKQPVWNSDQQEADQREAQKAKERSSGRPQRVIKHPLFHPFNAKQAEEHLGPASRGACVIRPSSKGLDHLAVTWKVSDNVFQHVDVLELDKENEFSVGRTLKVSGKYTYSDLDELIALHVQSMAKKVDEIMGDERFQVGSKTQAGECHALFVSLSSAVFLLTSYLTEEWLTAYMEANPRRSMYAFVLNQQYPGYFYICFKPTPKSPHNSWPIKVVPNAFEMQHNPYPDMRSLKNGFKTMYMKMIQDSGKDKQARRPPPGDMGRTGGMAGMGGMASGMGPSAVGAGVPLRY